MFSGAESKLSAVREESLTNILPDCEHPILVGPQDRMLFQYIQQRMNQENLTILTDTQENNNSDHNIVIDGANVKRFVQKYFNYIEGNIFCKATICILCIKY